MEISKPEKQQECQRTSEKNVKEMKILQCGDGKHFLS